MARVLIIDDDPDIIDSLSMILEANGHAVEVMRDTSHLIQDATKANPDLIILDVIFPEDPQAGFKAARTLRHTESLSRIPVLMLSAVNQRSNLAFSITDSDISEDFLPVGAFLEKPVEPKALLQKIAELLHPAGSGVTH